MRARVGRDRVAPTEFKHLWWLSAVAIPVGAAVVVLASDDRWFGAAQLSTLARAQIAARILMTEAAMAVVAAPLAGVWGVARARHSHVASVSRSGVAAALQEAWPILWSLTGSATVLALSSAIMMLALGTPDVATLWTSHAVLWAATLALAALGTVCAAVFREPLDAAACSIGIALVISVGLLVAGPLLDNVPWYVLNAALLASPIVATASSANIDIFRTDPLYQLSSLAHTRIDYPTPGAAFAWYVVAALLLFVGTALQIRRDGMSPIERISA